MSNAPRRGMLHEPRRTLATSRRRLLAALAGGALAGGVAGPVAPFSRIARAQDATAGADAGAADAVPENTSRYFAEAGHNLEEPFLSRW
ncbi:MAG TPA: hypothetical protein VFX03_07655, partial [Thermomicrobiales bacterium]|nr:hypothetical protein [Thermomicrobiales bacterium]